MRLPASALLLVMSSPIGSALSAPAEATPEQSIPVCIYASKSYSTGALVCVHSALALVCRIEGLQATWAPVNDKELSGGCTGPTAHPHAPRRLRTALRTRRHEQPMSEAKCFNFAGKRYCE